MTGLLVSVRDADEARAALAGGADLIDVKEPLAGSLGAATPQVWSEVSAAVVPQRPVSVALGELSDPDVLQRAAAAAGATYAKVGLAGCAKLSGWRNLWHSVRATLPSGVAPVAVFYADFAAAEAPRFEDVLREGVRVGCGTLLIDTFDKTAGPLLQQVSARLVQQWIATARRHSLRVVVGGSLDADWLDQVLVWQPEYIAVRGAVCNGSRTGRVVEARVRQLRQRLDSASP